jgi:hypothetical protein
MRTKGAPAGDEDTVILGKLLLALLLIGPFFGCCLLGLRRTTRLLYGFLPTGVITAVLLWGTPSAGITQDSASIASGRQEFVRYCAVCHGLDGKGTGPMARQLGITPADLTQIRKKHGGEFPFSRVYEVIDGREEVKEKGSRVMPVWGTEFQKELGIDTPDAETLIKERILNLVYYVQSIQK